MDGVINRDFPIRGFLEPSIDRVHQRLDSLDRA
jgi:hypothetical protein